MHHPQQGSSPQKRHSGCLVMLTIALVLGGLFYGIFWGLQGAYLDHLSPLKSNVIPTQSPSPTSAGVQP